MNPDTIGYVWTGEYDLNTLRVDGEIFESVTKKLRIRKYLDTCGRGLKRVPISQDLLLYLGLDQRNRLLILPQKQNVYDTNFHFLS